MIQDISAKMSHQSTMSRQTDQKFEGLSKSGQVDSRLKGQTLGSGEVSADITSEQNYRRINKIEAKKGLSVYQKDNIINDIKALLKKIPTRIWDERDRKDANVNDNSSQDHHNFSSDTLQSFF